jgi:superfamily I DNA/RNA helicase
VDYKVAVASVKDLKDGDKVKYQSRGIDQYSPKEWFFKIEKCSDNCQELSSQNLPDSPSKTSLPEFKKSEKTSQKVYGPPGTGKTTEMMKIIQERLEEGVKPDEICFVSYTNVAANEAKERVSLNFPDYETSDFPFFKTIHALATTLGGLDGKKIMSNKDMENFDKTIFSKPVWTEKGKAESVKYRSEHICLSIKSLATAQKTNYLEQAKLLDESDLIRAVNNSCNENKWDCPYIQDGSSAVEIWMRAYNRYKAKNNFVDYDDVIAKTLREDFDTSKLRFKLLIIDEAQDCSDFMWDFLKLVIQESKEVYICGDDDQAIMDGFGANSQAFFHLETTEQDKVLSKSYRLNQQHFENLTSKNGPLDQIKLFKSQRREKTFTHNGTNNGSVTFSMKNSDGTKKPLDLENIIRRVEISKNDKEWLILAPTVTTVNIISDALIMRGVSHFKSNQPIYNGESLEVCNIRVQTIHTSKGAEAENVAIAIITATDNEMYYGDGDKFNPALRYVAESRSKEQLLICMS